MDWNGMVIRQIAAFSNFTAETQEALRRTGIVWGTFF
jgi:hypothetical protein